MRLKIATILITAFLAEAKYLHGTEATEENKNNDYSFSYGVKDIQTGDVKDQWESKQDGVVKGQYSIMEPGGMMRTVEYVADKEHGFNAVVKYKMKSHYPISSSHQEVEIDTDPPKIHDILLENKFSESNPKPTVFTGYKPKTTAPSLKPINENQAVQAISFPIDLSFLESNTKIIPLTISKITPVEIKVDDSAEEQQKPIENNNRFSQPFLETDFKPVHSKINAHSVLKMEKKPFTTPGLRNYATGQVPSIQTILQQEILETSALRQFPEKKLLRNFQNNKLRPAILKRPPTIVAVKYY